MLPLFKITPNKAYGLALAIGLSLVPTYLHAQEKEKPQPTESTKLKSRILLTNRDSLTGQPHRLDEEGNLEFTSESLRSKVKFPLDKLLSLELDTWKYRKRPETMARVELHPTYREPQGDTLLGSLTELTPESIKLDTWYAGEITLNRKMVKSLQILNSGPGSYYGPNSIQEWTLTGGKSSWKFKNGTLKSDGTGSIGRDVGLTEKSHLQFKASWEKSMRFRILLYSNDVKDDNPDACYDVNFNRTYVYLRTRGKAAQVGLLGRAGKWKPVKVNTVNNTAIFDLFMDRKTGTITVYINNQLSCVLQSQNPNPADLGKAISFVSEERYPIEISALTVSPWNGTSFPNQVNGIEPTDKDTDKKTPPHRIVLKNGDEVPGTVGKVEDGRMTVETEHTPIRIPLKRIKSLNLSDHGEQPRKYGKDVRAWFHDGGYLTLRLDSFKDGKVTGFSQAFGDVSVDLKAFSKIDFHIYDIEYKKLRGESN